MVSSSGFAVLIHAGHHEVDVVVWLRSSVRGFG